MKILLVASEVAPFAKTGGLADVMGALPKAVARRGHDVRVVMPFYGHLEDRIGSLKEVVPEFTVRFPDRAIKGSILEGTLPGSSVPIYFVDQVGFFHRRHLYGEGGQDYADNPIRFAYLCRAALTMLQWLNWKPDLIHCNDWQAAMIPVFLKGLPELIDHSFYRDIPTLFTVHNLAYQGLCGPDILRRIGLPWHYFHPECMEYWGWLNFLKGGIAFADWISTVSPQYAREIMTREFGCGLEGFLAMRRNRLTGILNGVDYTDWDPETDSLVARNYSARDLTGKAACKEALERRLRWPHQPRTPIIGMVSRLDPQKGIDLFLAALPQLVHLDARFVILGSGHPIYHQMLELEKKRHPDKLRVRLVFDNNLAHMIEGGADAFLMPSRYEPCGLNQMFSLKYGAVPIVRETGGLADTVTQATPRSIRTGEGTGFVFQRYMPANLVRIVNEAVSMFHNARDDWKQIQRNGMVKDFSWDRSAREYERLYDRVSGLRGAKP